MEFTVIDEKGHNNKIKTFPKKYDISIPDDILFPEYMLKRMEPFGDRVACVDFDTKITLTYAQIRDNSFALAAGFQNKFNLKRQDNVILSLPNCLEYPIVVFGVMLCGATVSLINPAQTINELKHSIKLIKPKIWVCTFDCFVKLQQIYEDESDCPSFILMDDQTNNKETAVITLKDVAKCEQVFQRPTIIRPREDTALILFSSGTTGVPKGVMLTHRNLMAARLQTEELWRHSQVPSGTGNSEPTARTVAAILPFYHTMGLSAVFDSLVGSVKILLIRNFSLRRFLLAIQDFKVTNVFVVPAIAIQLAKQPVEESYDLSSVKLIRSGSAALGSEILNILKTKFKCPVYQGYGMTEGTLRSHNNCTSFNREGSIGVVMPFCECKVIDPENNNILGPYQEGELCVRGEMVMKGYIGDTASTSATIDQEGWLHSGDVGYYDNDGFFFVTDRLKELIKYKGFQISPNELENILLTHPDVVDAAVAGIADQWAGEVPRAYIIKRSGSTVTGDELATYLSTKVSPYKQLRGGVVFIDAIPRTPTGKIIRRELEGKTIFSKL